MTATEDINAALDSEWGVPVVIATAAGATVPCIGIVMSGSLSQTVQGQAVDDDQVVVSVAASPDVQVSSQGDQLGVEGGGTYLIARVRAYAGRFLFDLQGPV